MPGLVPGIYVFGRRIKRRGWPAVASASDAILQTAMPRLERAPLNSAGVPDRISQHGEEAYLHSDGSARPSMGGYAESKPRSVESFVPAHK